MTLMSFTAGGTKTWKKKKKKRVTKVNENCQNLTLDNVLYKSLLLRVHK